MPERRRKRKSQIECEGRFSQLRKQLAAGIELMAGGDLDYRIITRGDLKALYDLVERELRSCDSRDPYYHGGEDLLRTDFAGILGAEVGLGLVPLITEDVPLESALVEGYVRQLNPAGRVIDKLLLFAANNTQGVERLDKELGIDMSHVYIPCRGDARGCNLTGYKLAAGFGIGPNKPLENLVFDAPFHIELHKLDPKSTPYAQRVPESSVLGIGFWLNANNDMLLAQIQGMRGSELPKDVEPGHAGFAIAEAVARAIGFSTLTAYAARTHPLLRIHPKSKLTMEGMLRLDFDCAAKTFGYTPITTKDSTNNDTNIGFTKRL